MAGPSGWWHRHFGLGWVAPPRPRAPTPRPQPPSQLGPRGRAGSPCAGTGCCRVAPRPRVQRDLTPGAAASQGGATVRDRGGSGGSSREPTQCPQPEPRAWPAAGGSGRSVPYQLGGAHAPPPPGTERSLRHAAAMSRWSESRVRLSICKANELMAGSRCSWHLPPAEPGGGPPPRAPPSCSRRGGRRGPCLLPAALRWGVAWRGRFSLDVVFQAVCMRLPLAGPASCVGKARGYGPRRGRGHPQDRTFAPALGAGAGEWSAWAALHRAPPSGAPRVGDPRVGPRVVLGGWPKGTVCGSDHPLARGPLRLSVRGCSTQAGA